RFELLAALPVFPLRVQRSPTDGSAGLGRWPLYRRLRPRFAVQAVPAAAHRVDQLASPALTDDVIVEREHPHFRKFNLRLDGPAKTTRIILAEVDWSGTRRSKSR